jgi:phage terminase large subunit-like protein
MPCDPSLLLKALVKEAEQRAAENKLLAYSPYIKQQEFHALGATVRERLLMAGNQLGKSYSGASEMAMHLTGEYPDWWQGRRFDDKPVMAWAGSVTSLATRDTVQRLLMGRPGNHGTGSIPKKMIIDTKVAMGVADLLDHVKVQHKSGGTSILAFKSYEQGREKWQGETLDVVWFDEEPNQDIYFEGLTRTNATGGMAYMTFTPLLGMSEIVRRFLMEQPPGTSVVTMTIDDAEHYTQEQREAIIASYPPHEREARAKGVPTLGSGRIFPVEESMVSEAPFQIPEHWPRICGLDFGWDHPTAAAWMAWDRDTDTIHLYDCYRISEQPVAIHAAAIKAKGDWIPVAWPHDGLQHDKGAGLQLAEQYREHGVNMCNEMATFPEDGPQPSRVSVEAGVAEMLDRMMTGRWKVAAHLAQWFEEFRLYHRDNGKIVKDYDDLLSASRYGMMMLRYAATQPRRGSILRDRSANWRIL